MNKVSTVCFRVYPHERHAIDAMAQQEGRKASEFLRELIRNIALQRGIAMTVEATSENLNPRKDVEI